MSLDSFKGKLPYSSELIGVYKPLIGWKSNQIQNKMKQRAEYSTNALTKEILSEVLEEIGYGNSSLATMMTSPIKPKVKADVIGVIQSKVNEFLQINKKFPNTKADWETVIQNAKGKF